MSSFTLIPQNLSSNQNSPKEIEIETLVADDGSPIIKIKNLDLLSRGDTVIDIIETPKNKRIADTQTTFSPSSSNDNISFLRSPSTDVRVRTRLDSDNDRTDNVLLRDVIGSNSFRDGFIRLPLANLESNKTISLSVVNAGVVTVNRDLFTSYDNLKHYNDIEVNIMGGSTNQSMRSTFSVKNTNEFRVRVEIYRKINDPYFSERWNKILTVGIPGKSSVFIVDEGASIGKSQYMVVMPNKKMFKVNTPSIGRFANSNLVDNFSRKKNLALQPITLQTRNYNNILLYDLPDNCINASLYVGTTLVDEGEVIDSKISLFDKNATLQSRKYKYVIHLRFRDGSMIKKYHEVLKYATNFGNDIKLKIRKLEGDLSSNSITVNVNCTITKQGIETLINSLREVSPEIVESYSGDISELRTNIRNLLFYQVERFDTKTGNSYNIGIFQSDVSQLIINSNNNDNVPLFPTDGHMVLRFTPVVRSPITIFESSDTQSQIDDLETVSLRFRRFFHPVALSYDVIPASSRIQQAPGSTPSFMLATSDELLLGRVTSDAILEYSNPITRNLKTFDVKTRKLNRRVGAKYKDLEISWNMNGVPRNGYGIILEGNDTSGVYKILQYNYWSDKTKDSVVITRPPLEVKNINIVPIND